MQRAGDQGRAGLFHQHGQVEHAQPEAVVVLADQQAGPAQIRHLGPERFGRGGAIGHIQHAAQFGAGPLLAEKLARRIAQENLFFVETEVHGCAPYLRGRPSTRSAMTLRKISDVPPSIELARARRYPNCQLLAYDSSSSARASVPNVAVVSPT